MSPICSARAHVLLGQLQVRDGQVVGVERDRHAHPVERPDRVLRDRRHDARPASSSVGARSSVIPRARSSAHSAASSIAPGPWAMRSGSTTKARRTCARAAPFAGVDRHAQSVRAGRLERAGMDQRVRVRRLLAGQVPAGQPLIDEPGRGLCQLDVPFRVVRAQRRRDQADRDAGPLRRPRSLRGQTAAIPSASDSPPVDVEQRSPADLDVAHVVGGLRPRRARRRSVRAPRRPASARSAGRIASSSSACDVPGISPTSASDIPTQSRGASIPRVRASSIAVSIRNEPSRWRWSSALGIASSRPSAGRSRRRRGHATVDRRGGHRADATIPPPRPSSRSRTPPTATPTRRTALARIVDPSRQAVAHSSGSSRRRSIALGRGGRRGRAWTRPAADGSDRTGRTGHGDAHRRTPRSTPSRPICATLSATSQRSASRRGSILASLSSNETDAVDAATATGHRSSSPTSRRATERDPRRAGRGPDRRARRRRRTSCRPTTVERHAAYLGGLDVDRGDRGRLDATDGRRARARTGCRGLLAAHDQAVVDAAAAGREAEYADALDHLDDADAAIADAEDAARPARRRRSTSRRSTSGSTGAAPTTSRCGRCTTRSERGASTRRGPRGACAKEQAAKDRLPPDTRSLVLIMADIGQGGINDAADRHRAGAQPTSMRRSRRRSTQAAPVTLRAPRAQATGRVPGG